MEFAVEEEEMRAVRVIYNHGHIVLLCRGANGV